MRSSARVRAIVVASLFLASGWAGLVLASGSSSAHLVTMVPEVPSTLTAGHSKSPSLASCSTPASNGIWGSGDFFSSVKVTFAVPGDPGLSGDNFNVTPCSNTIPTYVNGFWMNISTSVPLLAAQLTVWGTSWSFPSVNATGFCYITPCQTYASAISSTYSPGPPYGTNAPNVTSMYINPATPDGASYFFNDYEMFWPGDQVYFNLTVYAYNATPSILYSDSVNGITSFLPNGTNDAADWWFTVASPWSSNNFTQDISVSTTPNVLGVSAFDPNSQQSMQITLNAINLGQGTTLTIPEATINVSVSQNNITGATYGACFGPANHSVEYIVNCKNGTEESLGPFAGQNVSFTIAAWVVWEGGVIDRIYSPVYSFSWSNHGGWPATHDTLEDNVQLSTDPSGLNSTPAQLPTLTPVNVSIHEKLQNVTIGSSWVQYRYVDAYGATSGTLPMISKNYNTSYLVLPGLPAGSNMTFSVLAKDIFGNTISSENFSYYEKGPLEFQPLAGTGYLFFEAVDLSTGRLVQGLPFQLSNSTWEETSQGNPYGFAGVLPPAGFGYLPLSFGNYSLVVNAFGFTERANVEISSTAGTPIVFYFTTAALPGLDTVSVSTFTLAAALGIIAAGLAFAPIYLWWNERRRKAEREQKRISL
jgi:hypothetical protein